MSRANVEIVALAHEAFNRRDRSVLLELLAPDVEWDDSTRLIDPALYRGHEGLERFLQAIDEAWEEFRSEPERLFDAGDLVVAFVRVSGPGRASALRMDAEVARNFTLKEGRITASRYYGDREAALEAAGLREQPLRDFALVTAISARLNPPSRQGGACSR